MDQLDILFQDIISRVNMGLRETGADAAPCVQGQIAPESLTRFYAFYGQTSGHPLGLCFSRSSLAGTYFLGKCEVQDSVLYKSDVRGDELKPKGTEMTAGGRTLRLARDEAVRIRHSALLKTMVHNHSHDPEKPEHFDILNSVAMHHTNIHGAPLEGCLLEPFATVDLTTCRNSVVGAYSYVQTGTLTGQRIAPGRIWIRVPGVFEFDYTYPAEVLERYIALDGDMRPTGALMDFFAQHEEAFAPIFFSPGAEPPVRVPETSSVSPWAVFKGECSVAENVLVAQRAYIENSSLGKGANAQENCYVIDSVYEGENITAHGGKVINSHMGRKVFTGFNSFVRGGENARLTVGDGCVLMPHTIIDTVEPVEIPAGRLVWGYVQRQEDLERQSMPLEELMGVNGDHAVGDMRCSGNGKAFVEAFAHRIDHILEENGAFHDGTPATLGHAQKTRDIVFGTLQPLQGGPCRGLCPDLRVAPPEECA